MIDDLSIAIARTSKSDSSVVRIKGGTGGQDSDYDSEDLQPLATLMAGIEKENFDKEEQCENEDINMELGKVDIEAERVLEKEAEKEIAADVMSNIEEKKKNNEKVICRIPLNDLPARFSGGMLESVRSIKRKLRYSEVYSDSEDECGYMPKILMQVSSFWSEYSLRVKTKKSMQVYAKVLHAREMYG